MAKASLSQQTADKIYEMIQKQYQPGTKIPTEQELIEFLGVSRTTVREAVKVLCSRNILEIRRGNGTFVKENPGIGDNPLDLEFKNEEELKRQMFEISEMIQPVLMSKAADKCTDEDVAVVEEIHNRFLAAYEKYKNGEFIKPGEFRKLDVEFHFAVINICRNQFVDKLVQYYLASCNQLFDVWIKIDLDSALESFGKYHSLMLDALKERDHYSMFRNTLEHTRDIENIYNAARSEK